MADRAFHLRDYKICTGLFSAKLWVRAPELRMLVLEVLQKLFNALHFLSGIQSIVLVFAAYIVGNSCSHPLVENRRNT